MGGLRSTLVVAGLLAACGSSAPPASRPSARSHAEPDPSAPASSALPPPPVPAVRRDLPARETLSRVALEDILDEGVGHLLQHVQLEPARDGGSFIGHRIVGLDPAWQDGPVHVGDVVVRLNGTTLETPDKAQQALATLRVASELVLEVIRDGEPVRTHLAID